jgi:hypothetical protein
VARQVNRLDTGSPQIETVAITESNRIRSRGEVELFHHDLFECASAFSFESVDAHQAINGLGSGEVGFVDVNTRIVKQTIPGEVILMGMAVEHGIHRKWGSAAAHNIDRRVDDDGLGLSPDQKAVA